MDTQKEKIKQIEQEEELLSQVNEVQETVINRIINPILALANSAPFTISFVAKSSGHDKILQISKSENEFKEGNKVFIVKLDNYDPTKIQIGSFFKSTIGKSNRLYVPKPLHADFPLQTKVLIIKPID